MPHTAKCSFASLIPQDGLTVITLILNTQHKINKSLNVKPLLLLWRSPVGIPYSSRVLNFTFWFIAAFTIFEALISGQLLLIFSTDTCLFCLPSLLASPQLPPLYKMTVNREWKLNIMLHFFVHNFPEWTWPNEIATMLKGGFFFFFNFIIISTWSDHSCCEKKVPHNKLEQIRS